MLVSLERVLIRYLLETSASSPRVSFQEALISRHLTIMFLLLTKMDEGDMSYNILLKDFPRWGGGHRVSTISYTNSPLLRPTACEAREHLAILGMIFPILPENYMLHGGSYFTEFPLNSTTNIPENIRLCRCIRHGFALVDPHHPRPLCFLT